MEVLQTRKFQESNHLCFQCALLHLPCDSTILCSRSKEGNQSRSREGMVQRSRGQEVSTRCIQQVMEDCYGSVRRPCPRPPAGSCASPPYLGTWTATSSARSRLCPPHCAVQATATSSTDLLSADSHTASGETMRWCRRMERNSLVVHSLGKRMGSNETACWCSQTCLPGCSWPWK
jgi:hypothetical protein